MQLWNLAALCGLLGAAPLCAFVTLNTSGPDADSADLVAPVRPAVDSTAAAVSPPATPPAPGAVLFVAGGDQRVYAAWGLLEAMQEFHLRPDAVVAEGAAALPAAVFVLGYPMSYLDSLPPRLWGGGRGPGPTETAASADPRWNAAEALPWRWNPEEHRADLPAWLLPETPASECGAGPELSWRIAQLIRGAPDTAAARNHGAVRLAFQMTEARSGLPRWVENDSLQALIAASLVPAAAAAACDTPPEWIGGGVVSNGKPLAANWPVAPAHLVFLQMPPSAPPRPLAPVSALDSLRQTWNRGSPDADQVPPGTNLVPLALEREPGLPPDDSAAAWMQMGYRAGLRSLDVLRRVFRTDTTTPPAVPPAGDARALWMNASLNPVDDANLQLLRQRLRYLPRSGDAEDWIPELFGGGYFSHVSMEWIPPARAGDAEGLQITADEHASLGVAGGAAYQSLGQPLFRRAPSVFGTAYWAEPYYLPYRIQVAGGAGGIHPGAGAGLTLEPPWWWWLRFSVYALFDEYQFDVPTPAWSEAGAQAFFLREQESGLHIAIGPSARRRLDLEVTHRILQNLNASPAFEESGYEAVNFQAGLLFQTAVGAAWKGRLRATAAYIDPLVLPGVVRPPYAADGLDFQAVWRGLEVAGQGQYTDAPDPNDPDEYDQWNMPSVWPLSFGDQVWLPSWRHRRYAAMEGGFNAALGLLHLRVVAGGTKFWSLDGNGLEQPTQKPFWETDLALPGFFGPWRVAAGGFDHFGPFFLLQWGTNFDVHGFFNEWN